MDAFEQERYELVKEKLKTDDMSKCLPDSYGRYFKTQFEFMNKLCDIYDLFQTQSVLTADVNYLKDINAFLYSDILKDNYDKSFANPAYTTELFGSKIGQILSLATSELRAAIGFVFEGKGQPFLIRLELMIELFCFFSNEFEEDKEKSVDTESLQDIIYWFVSDYYETESLLRIKEMVDYEETFAKDIIENSDLNNSDYLYRFGEYITDNEIKLSKYMAGLSEEKIKCIADTFTEGYRIGFITTGKDLSIKKSVNIRYPLGMERVVKKAIDNFDKMGLKPVIYRAYSSVFRGQHIQRIGFFGANPNPQYGYDHSKDMAICLDGQLLTRRLECLRNGFEEHKEKAYVHGGPAVIETFGEQPFVPVVKKEAPKLSEAQQKLTVKYASEAGSITDEYIKGEERSFTIIAFPTPEIGSNFEEIFDETLEINTLDYYLYQKIQQNIIDVLDKASYVHIKGSGNNKTDININLCDISDPDKETKFENCVADVNIPVGEVFTSPKLKNTTGIINVSEVYLNELKYVNLLVELKDGMVESYSCDNYEDTEKNKNFFKENVLFNHETLPIGEFAIGTNTRAFAFGRRFGIEGKLPILIAEKTGPHFALGDTCYSHAEDVKVYNPDKKEIIARDNEVSILRKTDMSKAYYNCHTDITLPYDEIDILEAVCEDGTKIPIISKGKFALPGMDELNKYL